jgi:uncharacterized SAM-binding protein YcdF (DUF218 family)
MAKTKSKSIHFLRIVRIFFVLCGILLFTCIILAFTSLPFWGIHWLGTSKSEMTHPPETIILMGGGGMPSESNLMRSWYVAKATESFPKAYVLIAMPGEIDDSLSTPQKIKNELVLRGVNPAQILFENKGTNTRSQAMNCLKLLDENHSILLVTSPEHARRSVLSFQKVGFKVVSALPAFEDAAEADFSFDDDELGGNKKLVPEVGNNISVRYKLWDYLKYEITIARELIALTYYKLRGWI